MLSLKKKENEPNGPKFQIPILFRYIQNGIDNVYFNFKKKCRKVNASTVNIFLLINIKAKAKILESALGAQMERHI